MDAISEHDLQACLTDRFGPNMRAAATRLGRSTWRLSIDGRPMVAKRMPPTHRPRQFRQVMLNVAAASIPCPPLLECLEHDNCWFALFEFLDGNPIHRSGAGDAGQGGLFELLASVAHVTLPPTSRNIEREWLDRVSSLRAGDAGAARLLDDLDAHPPSGRPGLAHGDFAPQNLLDTRWGLALIDWEEVGAARPGFDAGWLLALNRIGAGLRVSRSVLLERAAGLGIPLSNAVWFEKLGLLRLQWRAQSLLISHPHVGGILERVRTARGQSAADCIA